MQVMEHHDRPKILAAGKPDTLVQAAELSHHLLRYANILVFNTEMRVRLCPIRQWTVVWGWEDGGSRATMLCQFLSTSASGSVKYVMF